MSLSQSMPEINIDLKEKKKSLMRMQLKMTSLWPVFIQCLITDGFLCLNRQSARAHIDLNRKVNCDVYFKSILGNF